MTLDSEALDSTRDECKATRSHFIALFVTLRRDTTVGLARALISQIASDVRA